MTRTTCLLDGTVSCTATVASPGLVVSCVLVADTVTSPLVAGAVSRPDGVIVPAVEDHVTAEL